MLKVSEALNRLLKVLIIAINAFIAIINSVYSRPSDPLPQVTKPLCDTKVRLVSGLHRTYQKESSLYPLVVKEQLVVH